MPFHSPQSVSAITVSVHKVPVRQGSTHTYHLNGSTLRDILVDGRWITVAVVPNSKAA